MRESITLTLAEPNAAPSVAEGLPWRITPWGDGSTPTGHANIVSDVWEVVMASELVEETAVFIVKAVNCHHDLLEALKAITSAFGAAYKWTTPAMVNPYMGALAAIAKANGADSNIDRSGTP